jgi:hypothetical protein
MAESLPQKLWVDEGRLIALARELALDILPLETILKNTDTTLEQFETIVKLPRFQQLLAEATSTWSSSLNAGERVKVKAMAQLEDWMPELHQRLYDPRENLTAKIEGAKLLKSPGWDRRQGRGHPAGRALLAHHQHRRRQACPSYSAGNNPDRGRASKMNRLIHQVILIGAAYILLTLVFYTALSNMILPAYPHDIYSSLRSNEAEHTGMLCCGGDEKTGDCEAIHQYEVKPNGDAVFITKRYTKDGHPQAVLIAKDKIQWLMIAGGSHAEAHWCGRPSGGIPSTASDQIDPDFVTYCAFIAPGGV